MKTTEQKWIDLGDWGQHQATVVAHIDIPCPFIEAVDVTVQGETLNIVRLLPRDIEQMLLEEITLDRDIGAREFAEELAREARMAA